MAADSGVLGRGASVALGASGFGASIAGVSGAAAGVGGAFGISVLATGGGDGSGTAADVADSDGAGVSASAAGATVGGVIFGAGGTAFSGGVISRGTTADVGGSGFSGTGKDRVVAGAIGALLGVSLGGSGLGDGAFFGTRAVCGRSRGEGRASGDCRLRGNIARERGMTDGGGRRRSGAAAAFSAADPAAPDRSRGAGR
jgi:hypothetical protein